MRGENPINFDRIFFTSETFLYFFVRRVFHKENDSESVNKKFILSENLFTEGKSHRENLRHKCAVSDFHEKISIGSEVFLPIFWTDYSTRKYIMKKIILSHIIFTLALTADTITLRSGLIEKNVKTNLRKNSVMVMYESGKTKEISKNELKAIQKSDVVWKKNPPIKTVPVPAKTPSKNPAPSETAEKSGENTYLCSLHTFSGGSDAPPEDKRIYKKSFEKKSLLFLHTEAVCFTEVRKPNSSVKLFFRYLDSAGKPVSESSYETEVGPDMGSFSYITGYGYEESDSWEQGRYTVEFYLDDELLETADFTVR